ncbi:MAG: TonB-dependent receptor [candidate division WOR-3 bacterium]|nr:TonB-dependent receptor [candidate division WOR-3 bacterium]
MALYSSLWAGVTGKIIGRVIDSESHEPLPGVNIVVENTRLGAATDVDGYYIILNVPPGSYSIRASMIGYEAIMVRDVKVSLDLTTGLDFALKQTVIEGKGVTVIAERPLIQPDLTSSEATLISENIKEMPVSDFRELLQLQAGVTVGSGGEIHIRGGRSDEIVYMIDGIPVSDPFSGGMMMEVENNLVQEMKVVSGTFNAEYGKAMSGVVSIVTKEGGRNPSAGITMWLGDYFSTRREIFPYIYHFDPLSSYNVEANLGGPIGKGINFFLSTRLFKNEGWLYGRRIFNPSDSSNFESGDPSEWYIESIGDSSFISMNPKEKKFVYGNLSYQIFPQSKLKYGFMWDNFKKKTYRHLFKYDPDGVPTEYEKSLMHSLIFTQAVGAKTFFNMRAAYSSKNYRSYVYEDTLDSRYVNPGRLNRNAYAFHTGGCDMSHYDRSSESILGNFDITSQITETHQVKCGLEAKRYTLSLDEFELQLDATTDWKPRPYPISSTRHNKYVHYPLEGAFFIQDKMEFTNMIVNMGVRYDYFYPDGIVPLDPRDPNNSYWQRDVWYKWASAKYQISPRLGIAFPITERGVLHFSYGHFFQIPPFQYLYHNPDFEVVGGELRSLMGNANLQPQKTTIYEVGTQQQFGELIGIDVTAYYKDIRNLVATAIYELYIMGDRYAGYVNRDYGNVKGITFSLKTRPIGLLSVFADYTYQVAEGNASDPNAVFYDQQSEPPRESEIQVVPLDWDQTHTINFTVVAGEPDKWGFSIIGRYGSGLPYTPEYQNIRLGFENCEKKPETYSVDLKAHKEFLLLKTRFSIFILVSNLFDRKNEKDVYLDTGRAGYSLIPHYTSEVKGANTLEDFLNRPDFYSEPRKIQIGLSCSF